MAVGGSEVSSHAVLSKLLAGADGGGVPVVARLLDSAAFSVAVFERDPEVKVAYVNPAAASHAIVAAEVATGCRVQEVFPQVDPAFIARLMDDASRQSGAMNLRGILPGGAAWSLDAVALDADRLLVIAEELGGAVSSRQRLEALLGSMDAIWRASDFRSTASQVVEQARRLFGEVDVRIYEVNADPPHRLEVLAANTDSTQGAAASAFETVAVRAATDAEIVEVSWPGGASAGDGERGRTVRAVPLTMLEKFGDGRTSLGALVFARIGSAPFTEAERHLMDEFGKLVGLAAHRALLLADARASADRLQLTLDLAMAFASSPSPRDIIQLLLKRTIEAADAERATLSRIERDELTIEASYARSGELTWVGRRYDLDWLQRQPLVKQALETRRPVAGGQLDVEQAAPEFRATLVASRQTAVVPLMLGAEPAGLLVVSRTAEKPFGNADMGIVELMGNAAMLALRNARLLEDLKAANTAKSEFLNLAAHELRTPVTVIKGYTSMLQGGAFDDGAAKDSALSIIQDKAAELARLVDSLLFTARLQSEPPALELQRVDAVALAAQAVERAAAYAQLRGGTVKLSAGRERVEVDADADSAGRILDNLLNNAIAYSDGAPEIDVAIQSAEDHVLIDVADCGRGIPPAQHAAIFDPFVRIERAGSDQSPGAGLGLYIARRLAESMGGDLSLVRSEPESGSVFRLRLGRGGAAGR